MRDPCVFRSGVWVRSLLLGLGVSSSLLASSSLQDPAAAPLSETPWRFEVTPFFWAPGLQGDITVGGHKASFDQSFSDVAESLKFGASLQGLIQYDRWVARLQVDYCKLSSDVDKPTSGGTLDTEFLGIGAAGGYRFDSFFEGWTLEVLGGFRVLHLDNELDLNGIGKAHRRTDIWDPIIGVRPSIPLTFLTPKLRLNPSFAVGGGGDSDLIFEFQPMLQYALSDHFILRFGYRLVYYDFEDKGTKWDVDAGGFVVGLGIAF